MSRFYEPAFVSSPDSDLVIVSFSGHWSQIQQTLWSSVPTSGIAYLLKMPPQGLWLSCRDATSSMTVTLQPPPPNARVFHCKENVDVKHFSALCSAGRLASRLSSTPHHLQQSMTLAFLENQLASALTLQSTQEYRYWLLIYTRFLVNEGDDLLLMI